MEIILTVVSKVETATLESDGNKYYFHVTLNLNGNVITGQGGGGASASMMVSEDLFYSTKAGDELHFQLAD